MSPRPAIAALVLLLGAGMIAAPAQDAPSRLHTNELDVREVLHSGTLAIDDPVAV